MLSDGGRSSLLRTAEASTSKWAWLFCGVFSALSPNALKSQQALSHARAKTPLSSVEMKWSSTLTCQNYSKGFIPFYRILVSLLDRLIVK